MDVSWELLFLRRLRRAVNKPKPTSSYTVQPSLGNFHHFAGAKVNREMVQESVTASEMQERGHKV